MNFKNKNHYENQIIMKRLITVIKNTFLFFAIINLFVGIIYLISIPSVGIAETIDRFKFLGFITIYGIITCIIFGYIDRPILEKRLLYLISICLAILLITSFIIDNQLLRIHTLYVLYGVVAGSKGVLLVDMFLNKKNR